MELKTIICIDCGCEVKVKKKDGRTKRCKEHQDKYNKKIQKEYQKDYHRKYVTGAQPKKQGQKRTYQQRSVQSLDDLEYCKNNWNKVSGCLNCICSDCIQQIENDTILPWENDGFYKDDEKIEYEIERSIG